MKGSHKSHSAITHSFSSHVDCHVCVVFFCSQLFIWQAHNALFMIRCLLKVFMREMSEEELHLQFSYQERAPGFCGGESSRLILKALLQPAVCHSLRSIFSRIIYFFFSFSFLFYFIVCNITCLHAWLNSFGETKLTKHNSSH